MVNASAKRGNSKFSSAILSGWDYGLWEESVIKVKRGLARQKLKVRLANSCTNIFKIFNLFLKLNHCSITIIK